MYKKSGEQLFIMQYTIEVNKQDYDNKIKNIIEYLTAMITSMMEQI